MFILEYPSKPPGLEVKNPRGLEDSAVSVLLEKMKQRYSKHIINIVDLDPNSANLTNENKVLEQSGHIVGENMYSFNLYEWPVYFILSTINS